MKRMRKVLKVFAWGFAGLIAIAFIAAVIAYWTSSNACDERKAPPQGPLMKAVVYCDYGSPDVIKVKDVEKPTAGDNQVLVRIRAASVNPLDWHYLRGTPYLMRIGAGMRKPKVTRLGVDFAGTVEAVGSKVKGFKPGDDVFGERTGAFAQYVTVGDHGALALKPANVTFEQAASVPIAAITALQALRDKAKVQAGQKVLINGASGGVGTFAVQIAKSLGAEVTGVCSTRNMEMVHSIGADHVIDYTQDDFTRGSPDYDVIVDNVGNRSLSECRRALRTDGKYVMIGGPAGRWIDPIPRLIGVVLLSRFVSQKMSMFLADLNPADLTVLSDLLRTGKIKPVIDKKYKLSEVSEAIRYVEMGHARGKVVITVD